MDEILCKKCGSCNYTRNGKVKATQRYKCKECGCNFIKGDRREKFTPVTKALAILLYGTAGASYGFIARLFKVSPVAVMKMLKREVAKMPEPEIDSAIKEVSFDEMWHFVNKKKRKLWVWRAVERSSNRTIGWCVGNRSAATFRRFFQKFEHLDAQFYTDNYEAYSEVISAARHTVGKKYTIGIEQNNSNVRHFLGRFRRRTKVVSKSANMVLVSLKLCWYLNECGGFNEYLNVWSSIYG